MEQPSVREVSERIEVLLDDLGDRAMPVVMEQVEELLQCVIGLYGAGLNRILEVVDPDLRRTLADDEIVGSLLVLNDLHPDDVDTRVQAALDRVRPYLGSHAGGVSLSGVDERRRGAPAARRQLRRLPVVGADRQERHRGRDLAGRSRRHGGRGRGHGRRRRLRPGASADSAVPIRVGRPRAGRAGRPGRTLGAP